MFQIACCFSFLICFCGLIIAFLLAAPKRTGTVPTGKILSSHILSFQEYAGKGGKNEDGGGKSDPGECDTLYSICLRVDRIQRPVIGRVITKEFAAVDLVAM